ncbi:DNA-directed RNA polymerase I subunit rpa49 [Malassezia psittaci]|uniref:DNA-directed RNA polymerase I subunit rpa49 n=1 Tax=Malassezia psittaci TaxID=1821823 RepID=A0AAF0F9P2_9BASI|nr:DNA-directed RNA polymerase I subunit rpa49 [Malassezia psittaci]
MTTGKEGSSKRRAKDNDASKSKKKSKTRQEESDDKVSFRMESQESSLGPVLAELAEFTPKSIEFAMYAAPSDDANEEGSKHAKVNDRLLVAGDTPEIQYLSSNWGWGASSKAPADLRRETRGYAGEYLLGIYDKTSKQVTLRAVPVFTINRSIKALSKLSAMAVERGVENGFDYSRARRDLGEAFGNKKQKQAARNMDRMKVNTENMDGVLEQVASNIDESVTTLPSEAELAAAINASRALPTPNLNAEDPAEVYPLDTLLPAAIRRAFPIESILTCSSEMELVQSLRTLPQPSPWLAPRLYAAIHATQDNGKKSDSAILVQIGYYIAVLLSFRRHSRVLGKSGEDRVSILAQKMRLPEREKDLIINHLTSRFAESPRGSSKSVVTGTGETKLLAEILVLALHMDSFSVAPQQLAQELSVPTQRAQSTQHEVQDGAAVSQPVKRWRLKLPLNFPQNRKRGPPRR